MSTSAITYAIADLHGAFDLLEAALAAIEAHAAKASCETATVVFLGDYVDSGAQSREVVERLIAGPPASDTITWRWWRWICLKGNHDDEFVKFAQGLVSPDWYMSYGGAETLRSYDDHVPAAHTAWLEALPLLHVDQHRVFVHAGLDTSLPLDRQEPQTMLWNRYSDGWEKGGFGARHIVHGHTPHRDGPRLFAGRTNLDTQAWSSGRLVVGVFDDARSGGPVDLLEIRRPADTGIGYGLARRATEKEVSRNKDDADIATGPVSETEAPSASHTIPLRGRGPLVGSARRNNLFADFDLTSFRITAIGGKPIKDIR